MNAPFQVDTIHEVLAGACVSISGLKKNPAAVIAEAEHRQVAILNRNRPVAYLISPRAWERICEMIGDIKLEELVEERLAEDDEEIEVSLDEL
jgi:antitoxin StbD